MTSQYWDAGQARAYHEFQYHFPEQALARKAIVVAGGTGGWAPPPSHGSRGKALTSALAIAPIASAPKLRATRPNQPTVAEFRWSRKTSAPPRSARPISPPRRKFGLRLRAVPSFRVSRRACLSKT
jgi:hypothetical protein